MNDKKLYPFFIGMFAVTVGIGIFNAYNSYVERKANEEERKLNAEERELRIEDLKRNGNGSK